MFSHQKESLSRSTQSAISNLHPMDHPEEAYDKGPWLDNKFYLTPEGVEYKFESPMVIACGFQAAILKVSDTRVRKIALRLSPERYGPKETNNNGISEISFQEEQAIYRRILRWPGIPSNVVIENDAIYMDRLWMNLDRFMATKPDQPVHLKASWVRDITATLRQIHGRRCLVSFMATDNVLITRSLEAKLIGFNTGFSFSLRTRECDMDLDGRTVVTDMFYLGLLIYQIMSWGKSFDYCCFSNRPSFPDSSTMPNLDGIFGGEVMRKCWAGVYLTTREPLEDWIRAMHALNTPAIS